MTRILIFYLLIIILQGCSSKSFKHSSSKLQNQISDSLKRSHKIEHGYLVALYELNEPVKSTRIYSKDYGKLINQTEYNKIYLKKISSKANKSIIYRNAASKGIKLKSLLLILQNKYNLFKSSTKKYLNNFYNDSNINELYRVDKIASFVPLLMPEFSATITSHYGQRKIGKKRKFHTGIDLASTKGSNIFAAATGKVIFTGNNSGYGQTIDIEHQNHLMTRYAHLKNILVHKGQNVIRGELIGVQGKTGNARGEHLHFEIRLKGKPLNPADFLVHSCK